MDARALVYEQYGDPSVLRSVQTWVPEPGPRQVRVRVKAAGVNPIDAKLRAGAFSGGLPIFAPVRVGSEFSGIVDAVGEQVTDFAPGDAVLGSAPGRDATATALISTPDCLVHKPEQVDWAVAAGVSSAGQAALGAVRQLGITQGETVVVHGASGGVGSNAVQLAHAAGAARVIGTASPRNHDYLASLGVEPVAYGPGLAGRLRSAAPGGVDKVLDLVGAEAVEATLPLVSDAPSQILTFQPFVDPSLEIPFFMFRFDHELLTELAGLHGSGALRIPVQEVVPLARAHRAHELIETEHVRGKVVIDTE